MPQIAPVIGAVASVVGTVGSLYFQGKAAKKADQQQKLTTRRDRRQAIRQMQLARSQALMSAQGAGSLYGSGAQGGIGALSSQVGAEMGYASAYSAMSSDISKYNNYANIASGIASIGGTVYQMSGGFGRGGQDMRAPDYTTGYNASNPAPTRAPIMAPNMGRPPSGYPGGYL